MALRINGQLVGGVNIIPSYTQAQYDALEVKPEYWICLDREYLDVPANKVIMSDGVTTVEEAIGKIFTTVLTTGSTTITISDNMINTNSMVEVYTTVYGLNPTNIVVSNGSITLTFEAQSSDVSVKVRVI